MRTSERWVPRSLTDRLLSDRLLSPGSIRRAFALGHQPATNKGLPIAGRKSTRRESEPGGSEGTKNLTCGCVGQGRRKRITLRGRCQAGWMTTRYASETNSIRLKREVGNAANWGDSDNLNEHSGFRLAWVVQASQISKKVNVSFCINSPIEACYTSLAGLPHVACRARRVSVRSQQSIRNNFHQAACYHVRSATASKPILAFTPAIGAVFLYSGNGAVPQRLAIR